MDFDPVPYDVLKALGSWLGVIGGIILIVIGVGFLSALFLKGVHGPKRVLTQLWTGLKDVVLLSPRRVWAIALLTFKEAIRRKALLVFVVFALLFMFGGWFLSNDNSRPELQVKVHVSFVLTAISYLILPVVLILSCWGLPEDIKNRSLHTVVTKPVRRNEVVMGRILGFTLIGTLVLTVMSVAGYVWIDRQIQGEAREQLTARVPVYGGLSFTDQYGAPTEKGVNTGDMWEFRSYIRGASKASAIWDFENVNAKKMEREPGKIVLESHFEAFRTHKGTIKDKIACLMRITNRMRGDFAAGVGLSPHFDDVRNWIDKAEYENAAGELNSLARQFEENSIKTRLSVVSNSNSSLAAQNDVQIEEYELMVEGFEQAEDVLQYVSTYLKGKDVEADWLGQVIVDVAACKDAAAGCAGDDDDIEVTDTERKALASALRDLAGHFSEHSALLEEHLVDLVADQDPFQVNEFGENLTVITREQSHKTGKGSYVSIDLYEDLVRNGRMRVEVFCVDPGQFLGMARPDLFIRTPDRVFASGFSKACLGIWLKMLMVVVIGVTASCFVKGPVAIFLTLTLVILGSGTSRDFLTDMVSGEVKGGGPLENWYRIVKHKGPILPLDETPLTSTIQVIDMGIMRFVWVIEHVIPNFQYVRMSPYVANGFDVPWNAALLPSLLIALGLIIPCIVIGHFSLKLREIEAK